MHNVHTPYKILRIDFQNDIVPAHQTIEEKYFNTKIY